MSVSDDLNMLIGHYGLVEVHKALQKRMTDDYDYLKSLFEKKEVSKPVKTVQPPSVEPVSVAPVSVPPVSVEEVKNTVVQTIVEDSEKKKFKDSKEQKLWQREMEEKKKKENLQKGISIKDLLTKENLKKWIEDEGRTYSYISREHVGCKDSEVSSAAKAFGIENTRKQIMIQGKK
jgi:hypothetical protein